MPFGPYKDFKDCVNKNRDKDNPKAFCAALHKKITGEWPGEMAEEKGHCKCIKCGHKVEHIPGYPCRDYVCPKCGGDLRGSD